MPRNKDSKTEKALALIGKAARVMLSTHREYRKKMDGHHALGLMMSAHELEAAHKTVARALKRSMKDTARLDYVEGQCAEVQADISNLAVADGEIWNVQPDEFWHKTVRRAIDAAMRGGK